MRRYIPCLISAILAIGSLTAAAEPICEFDESETVTGGVTYESCESFSGSLWTKADIIKIDMTRGDVSIKVLTAPAGSSSLATVKTIAAENGAVAAVNGDFFNYMTSGSTETNMLGMVYQDGIMVSSPSTDGLSSFVLTYDNEVFFDYFTFSGKVIADNTSLCDYRSEFEIYQVNKVPLTTGAITMITSAWGESVSVPTYCYAMSCSPTDDGKYKIVGVSWGGEKLAIPEGGLVFIANYSINGFLNANFAMGDTVEVELSVTPDVGAIKEATGGNTVIVKDGEVASFTNNITGRSQRTAIGVSKSGKTVCLVTIDGRQSDCPGMTQTELAEFMIALGCDSAMNLDGGGSTTMVTEDRLTGSLEVKNDVSTLRKISTAIGVFADRGEAGEITGGDISLSSDTIVLGDSVDVSAVFHDENYTAVTDAEITYGCSDSYASIAGSVVMPTSAGVLEVTASAGGVTLTKELAVLNDIYAINLYPENIDNTSDTAMSVTAYDRSGKSAEIPTSLLTYTSTGTVDLAGDTVRAGGVGTLTAHYENLSSTAVSGLESYDRPLDETGADSFEGELEGTSFTVAGELSAKKLIGLYSVNSALVTLSKERNVYTLYTPDDPNGLLGESVSADVSFTKSAVGSTAIVTLPNTVSHSIASSDSTSWSEFKNFVLTMSEKNIVILMPEPYYNMTQNEQKAFSYFLSELTGKGVNTFVVSSGAKSEVTVKDGVRYMYIGSVGGESTLSYGYDRAVNTFYRFTVSGDEIRYKKISTK